MIEPILLALTLGGVSVATYTDLKEKEVPNELTLPMIAVGVMLHAVWGLYRGDISIVFSGLFGAGVGFALAYPLYFFGGFGGGDVKLMTAVGSLLPTAPAPILSQSVTVFAGVPLFPLMILVNGVVVVSPFVVGYTFLCLLRGESISTKRVPVPDLKPGMMPDEAVCWKKLETMEEFPTLEEHGEYCVDPSDSRGLRNCQINGLNELWKEGEIEPTLKIERVFPFVPVIAFGTLLAILFGNVYLAVLVYVL